MLLPFSPPAPLFSSQQVFHMKLDRINIDIIELIALCGLLLCLSTSYSCVFFVLTLLMQCHHYILRIYDVHLWPVFDSSFALINKCVIRPVCLWGCWMTQSLVKVRAQPCQQGRKINLWDVLRFLVTYGQICMDTAAHFCIERGALRYSSWCVGTDDLNKQKSLAS